MTPPRDPTPEMIAAAVFMLRQSTRYPESLVKDVWCTMWDAAAYGDRQVTEKPIWRGNGRAPTKYRRTDGATVTWDETKTGKRPWRGSRWHRGEWKPNSASHGVATAETAMANIDRHWPKAMKPYPVPEREV